MKRYTKNDVEFHDRGYPAVNVKVYKSLYPIVSKIAEEFNCSEEQAQKAVDYSFEMSCDLFWNEYAQDIATDILGDVKIHSAGRSNGWLIVRGLPEFETWNAVDLAKWRSFEKHIKAEIDYQLSYDVIRDNIEANQWHKKGAEQYNYFEFSDGHSECLADWKQEQLEKLGITTIKLIRSCEW